MKLTSSIVALILVGTLLVPARLFALSVTPGRTELHLNPGEKIKSLITVTNDELTALQVTVSSRDWFVLPDNKDIRIGDWLDIHGSKQFILEPRQSRRIPVTVKAPKKAQGELVAMVSFRYITENSASMVTPMLSVSVYNTITGTEKLSGEVRAVAMHRWNDKIQMAVVARATGNIHIRPTGHLILFKSTGEKVADCSIKEGDPSYPGMDRGYFCEPMTLALSPGQYRLLADMHYRDLVMTKEQSITVAANGDLQSEAKP